NLSLFKKYDIIIDATDNFATRFIMNRGAILFQKPLISAGVLGVSGQIWTIIPRCTPCLECLLDPKQCETAEPDIEKSGILAPLPQIMASLEAMEAIKILTGNIDHMNTSLLSLDLWNNRIRQIPIYQNPDCVICGNGENELNKQPLSTKAG
ncbi:MAG: HesA/MoeB/ThiF family protein, partial [Thermoguttaceae bacterium]